ncbi:glutamine--tRNA ligase [Columbia Basin potato purple top phytoplasma]|uniref:Glutamine--tRNA ligase n=1 Tax=Columbia Basin potato purple top phytoplasma TaxID=307134 RepID=A0ABT5L903_9MOLU|nr:glutamine--tRNA ligase [Columbia Basin potato purple top phytoplasma]MDC9032094.1 glutamine--tRNA ligase [Columbia Basin potato purple top phytoplasma]
MLQESNFIKSIIKEDLAKGKYKTIITRFPPEPNGLLHLGHARSIIMNFELAKIFNGKTYLRYDDTNPTVEKKKYLDFILKDVQWLGYTPDKICFTSDYFDIIFEKAIILIKKKLAFVDDSSEEELKQKRGDLFRPGENSSCRDRSAEENLDLFIKMKKGCFKKGTKVLRAKIDMASPNMNLRDPVLYKIMDAYTLKQKHHFIFPSYDFSHPLSDSIEGISHSLCSIEFEDHRCLYNWVIKETEMEHIPTQIEFGRLNMARTVLSKTSLKFLVNSHLVNGWDDPRMPTLIGMKNKGYTPESIKKFILDIGLSKNNSYMNQNMLDSCLREDLQNKSPKIMAVIDPLKVTIINYPDDKIESREIPYHNNLDFLGSRKVFFSKHIYIEKKDFEIEKSDPKSKKFFLNGEIRLFYFYFIKAIDVIKNNKGEIIEILATYDPKTKSGSSFNERKPNGTIHFVEKNTLKKTIINFYQPLFISENPQDLKEEFNYSSWIQKECFIEGGLDIKQNYIKFQFIRRGYFYLINITDKIMYFNEIISLKKIK